MATPDNTIGFMSQIIENLELATNMDFVIYDSLLPENNKIFDNSFLQKNFVTDIPKNYIKVSSKVKVALANNPANPFFYPGINFKIILIKDGQEKIINVNKDEVNNQGMNGISFEKILEDYSDGVYQLQVITVINSNNFPSKKIQFIIDSTIQDTGNILVTKLKENYGFDFQAPFLESLLYKDSMNKVLFKINKFFPYLKTQFETFFKDPSKNQQEIYKFYNNFFIGLKATIYRTIKQPKNIEDIVNENNVYKILDSQKNQFAYDDFLDPGVTYYYIVKAQHDIDPKTSQKANDSLSEVQKITLLKDSEFYYLEKSIFNFSDTVDKKQETSFMNKIFIDSVFDLDSVNEYFKKNKNYSKFDKFLFAGGNANTFNSSNNFPYIKIRITSKKTNRKIDLNLNYIFQEKSLDLSQKIYLQNKNVENVKFIFKLSYEKILNIQNLGLGGQLLKQINELETIINDYNKQNNRNVKLIRGNGISIVDANSRDILFIIGLINQAKNNTLLNVLLNFDKQFVS